MSAKSLQTVMTTFRAKLKKTIMDYLDYVADVKDGGNLEIACKGLLRGHAYIHDGDKVDLNWVDSVVKDRQNKQFRT